MDSDSSEPGGKRGYQIFLINCCRSITLPEASIRRGVRHVLGRCGVRCCHLEIAILGDIRMARLNERWLGRDGPTDVIAFDLADPADKRSGRLVGQISVCGSLARRRAARRGDKPVAELMLYIVHGLLHLLGYDDSTQKLAARMHQRTDRLLSELGYGKVYTSGLAAELIGHDVSKRSKCPNYGQNRRNQQPRAAVSTVSGYAIPRDSVSRVSARDPLSTTTHGRNKCAASSIAADSQTDVFKNGARPY